MNYWIGWIIEQSLDSQEIFDMFPTLKMKPDAEDNWKEHIVEVPEERNKEAVNWLKQHLLPSWYAHLVRDNKIIVIFNGRSFEVTQGDSYKEIQDYGVSHGVSVEQVEVSGLFEQARKSGY